MWYTDIALKRPLGAQTEARLQKWNKIIIHTMVGTLWGTDSYFRQGGYSGTESHFGTGYDGQIIQWQDDDFQADAQLEGNDDCLSIENADMGTGFPSWSGSDVPAFTPAQIEANAQIIAKLAKRHSIPLVLITNTLDSTRGIGYHRQGIDPYRTHGEKYSTSFGKVCPGDRRVAQIPIIIARAKVIMAGGATTSEDEDMFVTEYGAAGGVAKLVAGNRIRTIDAGQLDRFSVYLPTNTLSNELIQFLAAQQEAEDELIIDAVEKRVWARLVTRAEGKVAALQELADSKTLGMTSNLKLDLVIQSLNDHLDTPVDVNEDEIATKVAEVLIPAVVAAVAEETDLTAEEVESAAASALRKVLGGLDA